MRKGVGVALPKGVYRVRRWWYYQERRGKPDHGPNIKLPDFGTPEFWAKMSEIERGETGPAGGTFDALIAAYKAHAKWLNLSDGTKRTYGFALTRISGRWGPLRVDGLSPPAIQKFMDDAFRNQAAMGKLVHAVLRTILKWGVPRGYGTLNPAREVEAPDGGDERFAKPWPEDVFRKVVAEAPVELARMAVLGRATGQRVSDLVRLRPRFRDGAGIVTDIQKTKKTAHWCPLDQADIAAIDGWKVFANATYIAGEDGRPLTTSALRSRFAKWVGAQPDLKGLRLKIHDLRAMAVCDRRIRGDSHQRIAAAVGLSVRMVMGYSRGIDQRMAACGEREQNEAVKTLASGVKTLGEKS